MCFANAVLQVLVYCAPFAGLFARLHALLGPDAFLPSSESAHPSAYPHLGGGGENANASASGNAGNNKEGENKGVLAPAPLVRATGAFLREFLVSPKAGGKKPAGNGAGSGSGTGKGKGKASPAEEEEEEAEAFIPTGVYDVLKGKKRFDHMRVSGEFLAFRFTKFCLGFPSCDFSSPCAIPLPIL
jgi:ubiquitin carboxyl-terminal hydrolase 10